MKEIKAHIRNNRVIVALSEIEGITRSAAV